MFYLALFAVVISWFWSSVVHRKTVGIFEYGSDRIMCDEGDVRLNSTDNVTDSEFVVDTWFGISTVWPRLHPERCLIRRRFSMHIVNGACNEWVVTARGDLAVPSGDLCAAVQFNLWGDANEVRLGECATSMHSLAWRDLSPPTYWSQVRTVSSTLWELVNVAGDTPLPPYDALAPTEAAVSGGAVSGGVSGVSDGARAVT
jgi:hypothetical protein